MPKADEGVLNMQPNNLTELALLLKSTPLNENLIEPFIKSILHDYPDSKEFIAKQMENRFKYSTTVKDFDSCLKIVKIGIGNNILPQTFISQLLNTVSDHLFSFKNDQSEMIIPSEEVSQSAFNQWDIYIQSCKEINLATTLLLDAEISNRHGRADRSFYAYTEILNNPSSQSEIKQQVSFSIAELLMGGTIEIENTNLPKGLAIEDIPQINADDSPDEVQKKKRKTENILIARAIPAYEYILNYQNTEIGKRLIARFNQWMSGKDTPQAEKPKWLLRASLFYSEYYSPQKAKEKFITENQNKSVKVKVVANFSKEEKAGLTPSKNPQ